MYTLEIKNRTGVTVGTATIEKKLLGEKVRIQLMQEACIMYEANRRSGTAQAKTRSEVAGSRTKPFRQKGTGRARQGTKQSPVLRGGGVAHGPRPRDYSYDIGRKARHQALKSALLSKFEDNEVAVLDELSLAEPKTKEIVETMDALGIKDTVLMALQPHRPPEDAADEDLRETRNRNVVKSARNLSKVTVMNVTDLNAYEVLKSRRLLFTGEAFEYLKETL